MRVLAVSIAMFMLGPGPAVAEPDPLRVVECWDSKRGIVQSKRAATCTGEIVTSARADLLRRAQERRRRASLARAEAIRAENRRSPLEFASAGTAFAINRSGDLLTSAHVVAGCDAVELRVPGTRERLPVTVRSIDVESDLALVRSAWRSERPLRFAPFLPDNGEPLALIGYPNEGRIRLTPRLTPVHVDYRLRDPDSSGLTGVVGDVRRGHSGGPALDSRGRVTGVLKAKIDSVEAHRLSGLTLKHLGVLVDPRAATRLLERSRTRYRVDASNGRERSGRDLFAIGAAAVARLDCMRRR